MEELNLILTLTGCLAAALVCGYVTHRLGLSPIVGYLLAGVVVGPTTPGFVANRHLAEEFAEVGVVLLMFGVGLQFHVDELLEVRRVAIPGAFLRSLSATVLGTLLGRIFGLPWTSSIVFGLALSIASTVVLTRVLGDNNDMQTQTGRVAIGWLIVEDLFTIVVLVLLPTAFGPAAQGLGGLLLAVFLAVIKVAAMVITMFLFGERVIPWLLVRAAQTRSRELFTLTVLVVALGIAVGSARLFGISMPLGAFLAGLVVGRSEFSLRAATEALPMRDAFTVLFFVATGILFRPGALIDSAGFVAAALFVILIVKPAVTLAVMLGYRYPLRTTVAVAISTAQIGEFSFLLAASGMSLGLLDERATNTLIAAGIISITLSPVLYHLVPPLERLLARITGRQRSSASSPETDEDDSQKDTRARRAVVVGYGPVGQGVVRLFQENETEPVVVELNLQTVRKLAAAGMGAVYGDAAHRQTQIEADVPRASVLVLSSADGQGMEETIRLARELNPEIQIVARTSTIAGVSRLRSAGADVVFSSEGEVTLAMTKYLRSRFLLMREPSDRARQHLEIEHLTASPDVPESQAKTPPNSGDDPAPSRS